MHGVTRALNWTTSEVGNLNASKSACSERGTRMLLLLLLPLLLAGSVWRRTPKMLESVGQPKYKIQTKSVIRHC